MQQRQLKIAPWEGNVFHKRRLWQRGGGERHRQRTVRDADKRALRQRIAPLGAAASLRKGADRVELLAPDVLAPEAERVGQVQQDTWLHDFIGGKKAVQRQRNTVVLRFCMGKCGFRRLLERIVKHGQ